MRVSLLIAVCLLLSCPVPTHAQEADFCSQVIRCVSIFDLQWESVRGNAPVFVNPQVNVTLTNPYNEPVRVYVPTDNWRVIVPDSGKCPLLVVGIADDNNDGSLFYEDIGANDQRTRDLYTFCVQHSYTNLPNDPRIREDVRNSVVGFPDGEFTYQLQPFEQETLLSTVIERAKAEDCFPDNPADLDRFASQMAVFIALEQQPNGLTPWRFFGVTMQSLAFSNDYARIYCLLDQDSPPPVAVLNVSPASGDAPLTVNISDGSSGDIVGYSLEIVNEQATPVYAATADGFPEQGVESFLLANSGRYNARLTLFGHPQPYVGGQIAPQATSQAVVLIIVNEPPPDIAAAYTATPIPTPVPTSIDPVQQLLEGRPFPSAPDLRGWDAVFLLGLVIIVIVVLFIVLNGGLFNALIQNRRVLVILLGIGLIVLVVVLWIRFPPAISETPEVTPEITAEVMLDVTPELTPEITETPMLEITPELTPEATLEGA